MLSILLLLLPSTWAQSPAFVGCTTQRGGDGLSGVTANTDGCATTNYLYSFFQQEADTAFYDNCFCTDTFPSASSISTSSSRLNPTVCASANDYSAFRLSTTFVFDQCYTSVGNLQSAGPTESVRTLEECFTLCRGYTSLIVNPDIATDYSCSCASYDSYDTPVACSRDTGFFKYIHPYSAASAMRTRKRKVAERRAGVSRLAHEYCPVGLTACKVIGSEDGYECIDTSTELESCGGCMYGEYGVKSGTKGINCAALDDSSMGMSAMTCNQGQCVELA